MPPGTAVPEAKRGTTSNGSNPGCQTSPDDASSENKIRMITRTNYKLQQSVRIRKPQRIPATIAVQVIPAVVADRVAGEPAA